MRARVSVIVAAALTAMLIAGVESAGACSCAFGLTPKKQLKHAEGAFIGRLLSVRTDEGSTEAAFRYRVGRVFKGQFRRGRVVTVWDRYTGTDCAIPQESGDLSGLFVSRREGRWTSGFCEVISPRKMRRAARDDDTSNASAPSGGACSA